MINSNKINFRVASYIFYGIKMVRFGLDSNISCLSVNIPNLNGENLPILNGENLYDVLYGVLGKYPDSTY
jgi:hypothetical protein